VLGGERVDSATCKCLSFVIQASHSLWKASLDVAGNRRRSWQQGLLELEPLEVESPRIGFRASPSRRTALRRSDCSVLGSLVFSHVQTSPRPSRRQVVNSVVDEETVACSARGPTDTLAGRESDCMDTSTPKACSDAIPIVNAKH